MFLSKLKVRYFEKGNEREVILPEGSHSLTRLMEDPTVISVEILWK